MRSRYIIIYCFITLSISYTVSAHSISNKDVKQIVKEKLASDFFTRLYSNTYYNLLSRIEDDGYFQESTTGQYDGMYCRTVGAMVPLLLKTRNYDKAELLLKFVFRAMKLNGMNKIPHVIGKKIIHTGDHEKDSIYIIGRTDQIDGQAHNILAWAQLALKRGHTSFEDTTWDLVSALMDRSTEVPYMDSNKPGFIPDLIYNFNFEHSRHISTHYDLLTQCFTGSALKKMIAVAQRRKDSLHAERWISRLNTLKAGIKKYLTRIVNGKRIYLELLEKKGNLNIPFLGFSWVNLSPVAAQWEPLEHEVLVNTIREMQSHMIQQGNNFKWMPTESWPDGDFSGQMIGKGIGWEIEFSREEKDWERINEILSMLKIIQHNEPIYMENSYLYTGLDHSVQRINRDDLKKMEAGVWKIADPGNGEQAAWWCWATAKLRSELGLSIIPDKLPPPPEITIAYENKTEARIKITCQPGTIIYYSTDGSIPSKNSVRYIGNFNVEKPSEIKAVAYNKASIVSNIKSLVILSPYTGLEYSCFSDIKNDTIFQWEHDTPSYTGYVENFHGNIFLQQKSKYGIISKGYLKINRGGDYRFFILTPDHSRLFIDNQLVSFDINSLSIQNRIKTFHLKNGFHKLRFTSESLTGNSKTEIYFSRNNTPKEIIDSSMLLIKIPSNNIILPPRILPFIPEFDIDEPLTVAITSFDSSGIFYTLDGSIPDKNSFKYKEPFKITSSSVVKAVSIVNNQASPVSIMSFKQTENTKILLKFPPSLKYYAMGSASLLDGVHGTTNLNDGNWLGFEGNDFDVTLDLRKIKKVDEIKTDFLNNPGSWIFLPEEIEYFVSADGKSFNEIYNIIPDSINQHSKNSEIKVFTVRLKSNEVRFIRILGKNIGVCPKWHPGAGNKAWIFIDEIEIK